MYNRTYFTLKDLIQSVYDVPIDEKGFYLGIESTEESENPVLNDLLMEYFPTLFSDYSGMETAVAFTGAETRTMFERYFIPYYMEEVIAYLDNCDPTDNIRISKAYKDFLRRFCAILQGTYDKYSKVIGYYKSKEDDLLDQIASTSKQTLNTKTEFDTNDSVTQRFNDTPQNGGDFTADDYTSTYQKNTSVADQETNNSGDITVDSSTDGATLMARLDEIRKRWEDLYVQWSKEFSSLFIDSAVDGLEVE